MVDLISINGVITSPQEAKISVYDRGFLFGDAIYEVTRTYGDILFGVEEHIARLRRSGQAIHLDLGISDKEILKSMYDLVKAGNEKDIYIRLQVSRGNCAFEQISLKPQNTTKPNWVMYLHKLKPWNEIYYSRGVRLAVSTTQRNAKSAMDPNIKSGNYLNNILAFLQRPEGEYDDYILLDQKGNVTEGTTFNIFMVKGGKIFTPPDECDILHGITRKFILSICSDLDMEVVPKNFSLNELMTADEVFVSSSTKEVMPVHSINGKVFTTGCGLVTEQLRKEYTRFVEDYCERAKDTHPLK